MQGREEICMSQFSLYILYSKTELNIYFREYSRITKKKPLSYN